MHVSLWPISKHLGSACSLTLPRGGAQHHGHRAGRAAGAKAHGCSVCADEGPRLGQPGPHLPVGGFKLYFASWEP